MSLSKFLLFLCISLSLLGCASTKVETTGVMPTISLCQSNGESLSALVLWVPQWRPDQKEPVRREAAALRGIQDFFVNSRCVSNFDIRRLPNEHSTEAPSDEQLLRLAAAAAPAPDRVYFITVRELGPKLLIGIPAIVEGGTEVAIDVRVLNVQTSESMANVRTRWQNSGRFVIKGVGTLDQDMSAALRTTLSPVSAFP
jgi:hypothetical protein